MPFIEKPSIVIIGLGYVGLPLAVRIAHKYQVTGFDLNKVRVNQLNDGYDKTGEITSDDLHSVSKNISFTSDKGRIIGADVYIVAVPTPITRNNTPDLTPLTGASATVGQTMKKDAVVVYESTVYPGCTEEVCVPILEKESSLVFNKDFFVGYSPERINPGDTVHTVDKIVKVTSGSSPEAAEFINRIYASVISAGTYRASSIKVAEAAKVIENTQRDLNIAFMNELAIIFARMGIDTTEVLEAAETKWNFLPFKPGLVGGHCIGVDPYYLTYKAQEIGYHPEVILAGRRLNDNMGIYVASDLIKMMIRRGINVSGARIIILGITFKENCPDIRNTRVIDVIQELLEYGCIVSVYDPWADAKEVTAEYGIDILAALPEPSGSAVYDACMLTVAHREFKTINPRNILIPKGIVYDVKGFWPREMIDKRL
ncbi:nucleotide sugar dehydrogenase [Treponema primitia]|uniref:nucleotide sugar dehydrogenase n=1 Tax=Treponema primitia TaxID=88058 RepID=UPI000255569D|nr:nucleotide sugar dehydrogenase [Treponema primitia]